MKFNNLEELAKAVSKDLLKFEFINNKKFPIDKDLDLDISLLPEDENGDMAREEPEEFMRLVNNCITHRLNYMYEEGFLEKKNGYYRMYTLKEIERSVNAIVNSVD